MEKILFFTTLFWEHWGAVNTNGSKCVITIDFEKIDSLENLKTEISHLIDLKYKEFYKRYYKQKYRKTPEVKRIRELDSILQVGDMQTKGIRNIDLAKMLFANEFENDPNCPPSKISQRFNRYKKLIAGGYKELTYP